MTVSSGRGFPLNPEAPIERVISPFKQFMRYEASSGILLIISVLVAMIWINSSAGQGYINTWNTIIGVTVGEFELFKPVILWINDLLMAIFFLLVGLEIKRELIVGELSDLKTALMPISAAIGGIIVPALLYILFNFNNSQNIQGWAIPAATDIAFALGVLYLLGDRVPVSARVFLATLAIIDDIMAILIIALFYSSAIKMNYLLLVVLMIILLFLLNKLHVRSLLPYLLLGIILWYGFLKSGIHATIAGVILAFMIPATMKIDYTEFESRTLGLFNNIDTISDDGIQADEIGPYLDVVHTLEQTCADLEPPLQKLEHRISSYVAFIIMPLFALANAGVIIEANILDYITDSISLGIISGLFLGKPLGIFLFAYIAAKLNIAKIPDGLNWRQIFGLGLLAGIGFTMSTFISSLAFGSSVELEIAKVAILIASFISALIGSYVLLSSQDET